MLFVEHEGSVLCEKALNQGEGEGEGEGENNQDNDQGVELRHIGKPGQRSSAVSLQAMDAFGSQGGAHFVEVTVLDLHSAATLAIGVSKAALNNEDYPGWDANSIGLHGDDGSINANGSEGRVVCPSFGAKGDSVGVGVLGNTLFFTRNTALVETLEVPGVGQWLVCVALDAPGSVRVSSPPLPLCFPLHSLPSAMEELAKEGLGSVALGPDTIHEFLHASPLPTLVEFYRPVCGEAVGRAFKDRVRTAHVDASLHPDLAAQYAGAAARSAGRTIRLFRHGELVGNPLPTEAAQLALFCKQLLGPETVPLASPEDFVSCLQHAPLVVLGFFGDRDSEELTEAADVFAHVARAFVDDMEEEKTVFSISFRRRVAFATIETHQIASSLGLDAAPAVIFVKDGGKESEHFRGDMAVDPMVHWVNACARVWVCALTSVSVKRVPAERERLACFVFVDPSEAAPMLNKLRVHAASDEFRNAVSFFTCDQSNSTARDVRARFGMEQGCGVGVLKSGKVKYRETSAGAPSLDLVLDLCRRVLSGSAPVFVKSAPPVPDQPNPASRVRPIAASQFPSLVLQDADHDALVFASMQGEQSSATVRAVVEEVAADLAAAVPGLRFFEIDLGANDPPVGSGIESYPSLVLVKKDKALVKFDAHKTKPNVLAFLRDHSTWGELVPN